MGGALESMTTNHPETPLQGLRILDIGCGGGIVSEQLGMLILIFIQPDQINMAVFFRYFVKVRYSLCVHWTSYFLQGTRKTRPCLTSHPLREFNWIMDWNLSKKCFFHGGRPQEKVFNSFEMRILMRHGYAFLSLAGYRISVFFYRISVF